MDGRGDKKTEGEAARASAVAWDVKITLRSYLSTNHLYAAYCFTEDAKRSEVDLASVGTVIGMRHRAYILGAITEAVALIESAINEIYQDVAEGVGSYSESVAPEFREAMKLVWESVGNRAPILDKYNMALAITGNEILAKGAAPYQAAKKLIDLRNYGVHYKPHDRTSDNPHRHEKALRGEFSDNPLMAGSGNPWFPDHALGSACAEWAWRSARALADEFALRTGVTLSYTYAGKEHPLPC